MKNKLDQKIIIESLAMDLKRVALGLHQGSFKMAAKFKEEALKRADELSHQNLNDYAKSLLIQTRAMLDDTTDRVAEDALMLSTLFQNFAVTVLKVDDRQD